MKDTASQVFWVMTALKFSREFRSVERTYYDGAGRKVQNSLENFSLVFVLKYEESLFEFECIGTSMGII